MVSGEDGGEAAAAGGEGGAEHGGGEEERGEREAERKGGVWKWVGGFCPLMSFGLGCLFVLGRPIDAHLSPDSAQPALPARCVCICDSSHFRIRSTSQKFALSCSSQKGQTFVDLIIHYFKKLYFIYLKFLYDMILR